MPIFEIHDDYVDPRPDTNHPLYRYILIAVVSILMVDGFFDVVNNTQDYIRSAQLVFLAYLLASLVQFGGAIYAYYFAYGWVNIVRNAPRNGRNHVHGGYATAFTAIAINTLNEAIITFANLDFFNEITLPIMFEVLQNTIVAVGFALFFWAIHAWQLREEDRNPD